MIENCTLGKWAQKGVPHKGWTCVDIQDHGSADFVCQMCETMTIRYVHEMVHPDYDGPLFVGCICAGHMEEDIINAKRRESDFKNRLAKRDRFIRRDWKIFSHGNEYLNTRDGFNIVVFPRGEIWAARITDTATSAVTTSRKSYQTAESAKLAAFGQLERERAEIKTVRRRRTEDDDYYEPAS